MSKYDWGIGFTLAGCLALAGVALWDHQQQQKSDMHCEITASGLECRSQQFLSERAGIPSSLERVISNPEPRTGVDHEKRDLAAQEASAVWALWMVAVSAIGTLVTSIGTILLYMQIKLTRQAVTDTSLATDAMNKANEIAAESQRAWIDINPIFKIQPYNRDRVFVKMRGDFKNIGNTIATDVSIMTRFITGSSSEILKAHNEIFRKMIKEGGGLKLMPGKSRSGGQTTNGFSKSQVKWDENERALFCMITIAVYKIEGSPRRRYSRARWYFRVSGDEFNNGMTGLTWDEFVMSSIEVDPQSYLDCS